MKKKIIILVVVILIAIALYYFFIVKPKKASEAEEDKGSGGIFSIVKGFVDKATNIETGTTQESGIFGIGARGKHVEYLQEALNRLFDAGLAVDGIFGEKTERALFNGTRQKTVDAPLVATLMNALKQINTSGTHTKFIDDVRYYLLNKYFKQ